MCTLFDITTSGKINGKIKYLGGILRRSADGSIYGLKEYLARYM
jgi:hypothetical protein